MAPLVAGRVATNAVEILITGATGLLGRHLIQALQERGDKVRILALPGEDTSSQVERNIAVYRGDIRQPETLTEPMQGVDAVFHLAAMMGVWRPMEDYRAVNVIGTENVCRSALKAGVRRLVHISSWTVYGMNLGRPATEDMPLSPLKEPYAVTKTEGDKLVLRMIVEEGLPAVIIRPGTFFGPGDRLHFGRIADRIHAGTWITIGSGRNALPFVYVTDVVQGLLKALDLEQAAGQAYNITNDQPLAQQDLWRAIAEEIGARPPRIRVPYHALFAAGYAAEQVAKLTHARSQPIVTRLGVMLFGGDNRHSIEKARRELGYVPRVPLREGVRLAGDWYRKQNPPQFDRLLR
jgi:nucleoside-diphosphate-sugar epimerase